MPQVIVNLMEAVYININTAKSPASMLIKLKSLNCLDVYKRQMLTTAAHIMNTITNTGIPISFLLPSHSISGRMPLIGLSLIHISAVQGGRHPDHIRDPDIRSGRYLRGLRGSCGSV